MTKLTRDHEVNYIPIHTILVRSAGLLAISPNPLLNLTFLARVFHSVSSPERWRKLCADSWHHLVVIPRYYTFLPNSQMEEKQHFYNLSQPQIPALPPHSKIMGKLINLKEPWWSLLQSTNIHYNYDSYTYTRTTWESFKFYCPIAPCYTFWICTSSGRFPTVSVESPGGWNLCIHLCFCQGNTGS